ncbi:MAG: 3-deoxy-D-manno-octulosonic acid transferase [Bacteroidales bacterium]|jgi:3-deoxy-D-manno-octulosonic-acid transferase|nr:3-deoxy-D-manno-octulosonic acid transferase [Bacteroidales bacterium]
MAVLYQIFIYVFGALTNIYALFNKKIRVMVCGRKQTWNILKTKIHNKDKVLWVHCASLGEFEQGRVLMELFKQEQSDWKILLSFYSPSGYEVRKNYECADCVVYLPNDTKRNAKRFIDLANPKIAVFIKYEFWYNYISFLRGIKVFQVSLIVRENHYLWRWYSGWFRQRLEVFTHFFIQDATTARFMNYFGLKNYTITGDTRFDRVFQIAEKAIHIPVIEQWCNEKVLMLGSSWEADEQLLKDSNLTEKMKVIIVPHNIDDAHLDFLKGLFPHSLLYSDFTQSNISNTNVIIINTIGLLSSLYRYCYCAYVGGGFGKGIHNVLEAACFGKPVCFGTNYKKFNEAVYLVENNGARVITSAKDLNIFVNDMFDKAKYEKASEICSNYVMGNKGASRKIMNWIKVSEL